ncbi:chaperonin 10-like protein [Cunninghamella echinulata]|nr:chaperonin 10-like protein [Cunninghamella echinulata]
MYAQVLENFGGTDAFEYKQVPTPTIKKPTDLIVKVKAIGTNPIEAKLRSGNLFSFLVKKNAILGADYAGIIVAKGDQVSDNAFKVGDAVFGKLHLPSGPQGSYAEYILVSTTDDKAIAKKPENITFEEAAAVGIAGLTALEGVYNRVPFTTLEKKEGEDRKILIIGASGGVGTYAIQMGKAIGAYVVGICSARNASLVSETLGADRVVDYNNEEDMTNLQKEINSYDVVFDLVGSDSYYKKFIPLAKKKTGIFVTAAGPGEHFGSKKVGIFSYLSAGYTILSRSLFGCSRYAMVAELPEHQFASIIAPWFASGAVKSFIKPENVFDLKDVAKAHDQIESNRTAGKIVLQVTSNN